MTTTSIPVVSAVVLWLWVLIHMTDSKARRHFLSNAIAWGEGAAWLFKQCLWLLWHTSRGLVMRCPDLDLWFGRQTAKIVREFRYGLSLRRSQLLEVLS